MPGRPLRRGACAVMVTVCWWTPLAGMTPTGVPLRRRGCGLLTADSLLVYVPVDGTVLAGFPLSFPIFPCAGVGVRRARLLHTTGVVAYGTAPAPQHQVTSVQTRFALDAPDEDALPPRTNNTS